MATLADVDEANDGALTALKKLATVSNWPESEVKFRKDLVTRHHKNRRRLHTQIETGDTRAIRLQHLMLESLAGRFCALLEELVPAGGVALPAPMTTQNIDLMLKNCRPMRRVVECAKLHVQTKANGTTRCLISPGRKVRISQRLVDHVLDAWQLENPDEFNRTGRGRNAAVQKIVHLIQEKGLRHFVLFDLENFYASVKPSHLSWHPLPQQAMEQSVYFNRNAILLHDNHATEVKAARHGLPQGAKLSGAIASSLLGHELRSLSGAGEIVTYVDDGVIGACDPTGAKNLAEALKTRFSNHPGGPLNFKYLNVVRAENGFPFLGYWLRLVSVDDEEKVSVSPSHEAKVRLKRGVFKRLRELGHGLDFDKATARAETYRLNWTSGFPLWQPNELALLDLNAEVESYVYDFFSGFETKIPLKMHPLLSAGEPH